MTTSTDAIPTCFGQHYEPIPECVGGFDIALNGGKGGIRERCNYVSACSVRTHAANNAAAVIPASSLVRPHPTPFTAPSGYSRPSLPSSVPARMNPMERTWVPPHLQAPPQHFSNQYGVPPYLTMRQPDSTGGVLRRMLFEIVRSMGKSIGHTIAHFFDVEIFGIRPQQPQPPPQPPHENHGQ